MKKAWKKWMLALCIGGILTGAANAVQISDFSDVADHWAYPQLSWAVEQGLLQGEQGKLLPDGGLVGAEMITMLNRALHSTDKSRSAPNLPAGVWYAEQANLAASSGIIPLDGSMTYEIRLKRAQVFPALTAAFGLDQAVPDESVLSSYPDADHMTTAQRRAAAVLVQKGILSGTEEGMLEAARNITRSEFVSLLYRIYQNGMMSVYSGQQPIQPQAPVQLVDTVPSAGWYDISYDTVVLRGNGLRTIFDEQQPAHINRLVIGTQAENFTLSGGQQDYLDTVVVGGGTGVVTVSDPNVDALEITGSGRTVDLRGLNLESLLISGIKNQIYIDNSTQIKMLELVGGAKDNTIMMSGLIERAVIGGSNSIIQGSGYIENAQIAAPGCALQVTSGLIMQSDMDTGLNPIQITVDAPKVAPGGAVKATVKINGLDRGRICAIQWWFDGMPDAMYYNPQANVSDGFTSTFTRAITFSRNMPLKHTIGFTISYRNRTTGELETRNAQAVVEIQNYPSSHYLPSAESVLAKVSSTFRKKGVDYKPEEKVVFVNAKGYSSPSKYLIWVSRSAQKVNVFEGSKGDWSLIHEFPCATGKSSTPTPVGVTHVTYKQTGWTTSSYTCRPIVRFYPNTGYAFHSRLYYPGTNRLKDASIGFPVSLGCVRMLDSGINWLYKNVPSSTTVVIY